VDDIDHIRAEPVEGIGDALACRGEPIQESRREFFGARVDPDEDGALDPADRLEKSFGEMHGSHLRGLDYTDRIRNRESSTNQG
jgi:hypothetical protein